MGVPFFFRSVVLRSERGRFGVVVPLDRTLAPHETAGPRQPTGLPSDSRDRLDFAIVANEKLTLERCRNASARLISAETDQPEAIAQKIFAWLAHQPAHQNSANRWDMARSHHMLERVATERLRDRRFRAPSFPDGKCRRRRWTGLSVPQLRIVPCKTCRRR